MKLKDIEFLTNKICGQFEEKIFYIPTFGDSMNDSKQDATPLILELVPNQFTYFVIERGTVLQEKTTSDCDELLFWIFEPITFSLANHFAAKIRVNDLDNREILFRKQIELLQKINMGLTYINRLKLEYNRILKKQIFV